MKSKGMQTANILNIILLVAMTAIIALLILITFFTSTEFKTRFVHTLVFCYTAGALGLWFLTVLRQLVMSVCNGNPFIRRNVVLLKRLSVALLLLMGDFIYIFIYNPSVSKLLCIGLLLLGFFCALVLAYLIERAAEYREEIDLTV
jgi:hypothetical protein